MKTRSIPFITFGLLLSSVPLAADTFILKDGSSLEGSILRDEGDSYVLEVQVTATIKDEKTVAKADIEEIKGVRQDLKAFEEIENLVPTPDLLTSAQYEERILAVSAFLKEHPESPRARDARKMLATLNEEASAVSDGGVKMEGALVAADEYRANAYEIDSRVLEARIRDTATKGILAGAIRLFSEMARDFEGSAAYKEVRPVMRQVLQAYLRQNEALLKSLPARVKQERAGLERMSPDARAGTEQAIREQYAALDARFAREKASGRDAWVTPHPLHEESLKEVVRLSQAELTRIGSSQMEIDGGKAYRDTMAAIKDGAESAVINAAFTQVTAAKVPDRYIEYLKEAVKAAEEAPDAETDPEPSAAADEVEAP